MQGVDAWVVGLDIGPEPFAQVVGQRVQAGVVQRRLTFPQVVHEQVTDRAIDQLVAVDQLLRCLLPASAQPAEHRRCIVAEHSEVSQDPVEGGATT